MSKKYMIQNNNDFYLQSLLFATDTSTALKMNKHELKKVTKFLKSINIKFIVVEVEVTNYDE